MSSDTSVPPSISIDYVEFAALDLDATKAFYGKAFGWTFVDYGPQYLAFESGKLSGGFAKSESVSKGGALVILYAENLESALEAVKNHGGKIVQDIFAFPGGHRFHFTDPSGNELAVWSDK